jgi:hypothetical protein
MSESSIFFSLSLSLSPIPYISSRVGELDRFDIDLLGRRSLSSSVVNQYFPNRKKRKYYKPPFPPKKRFLFFYFFSNRPAGRPTLTNVLAGTTKCWRPTPRIVYSTHSLPFFLVAAIVLSFWLVVSNLNRRQGHCWLQGERVPCLAWWMELSKSQSLFYFILAVEVWTRKSLTKSPVFGKRKKKKKFQIWRRPAQADGRGPGVGDK